MSTRCQASSRGRSGPSGGSAGETRLLRTSAAAEDAADFDLARGVVELRALRRIGHLVGDPAAVHEHGGLTARDAERDEDVYAGDFVEGAVAQDDLLAVIVRPAHRRPPQVSLLGVEGLA